MDFADGQALFGDGAQSHVAQRDHAAGIDQRDLPRQPRGEEARFLLRGRAVDRATCRGRARGAEFDGVGDVEFLAADMLSLIHI